MLAAQGEEGGEGAGGAEAAPTFSWMPEGCVPLADGEYDAMVARVKRLAGLGPLKTTYDPNKRVYRNMPTAVQPKK